MPGEGLRKKAGKVTRGGEGLRGGPTGRTPGSFRHRAGRRRGYGSRATRPRPPPQLILRTANHDLKGMRWEDKRALVEVVFAGKTPKGERMGIYVERIRGRERGH